MSCENYNEKYLVILETEIMELIPTFIDNRRKDIIAIKEAIKSNDYETIRMLGHNMKGSGGGYGFNYISEIGKALQEAAESKNIQEANKWVDELEVYMQNVKIEYR